MTASAHRPAEDSNDTPVLSASKRRPKLALAEAKKLGRPSDRGRFLRINDVIATTGLSRATIYRQIRTDAFPKQVRLTTRAVGWWEASIQEWNNGRFSAA
jgi:prophage regulatory protein